MKKLFVLTSLLLVFTSCLEMKQKVYFQNLSDLTQQIDSITSIFENINLKKVQETLQFRKELFDQYIERNEEVDTIDVQTAQHIENIHFSIKNLNSFIEDYEHTIQDLHTKTKEIKQLEHIVKNGLGNRSEYDQLLNDEHENMANLKHNALAILQYYEQGMQDFTTSDRYLENSIHE